MLNSINIKKTDVVNDDLKKAVPVIKTQIERAPVISDDSVPAKEDGRKSNQRPSLSVDESFFSIADKQTRISMYLKILVQLIDELSFIQPKQTSILDEEKWSFNTSF